MSRFGMPNPRSTMPKPKRVTTPRLPGSVKRPSASLKPKLPKAPKVDDAPDAVRTPEVLGSSGFKGLMGALKGKV